MENTWTSVIFLSPIISIPSRVSADSAVESRPGLLEALVCVNSQKRPGAGGGGQLGSQEQRQVWYLVVRIPVLLYLEFRRSHQSVSCVKLHHAVHLCFYCNPLVLLHHLFLPSGGSEFIRYLMFRSNSDYKTRQQWSVLSGPDLQGSILHLLISRSS